MNNQIKAGCIVKTKFVTANSDIFSGYIDYIDRETAVRNEFVSSYSVYADYMDNPEKTTDLFTSDSDHLSFEETEQLKMVYEIAQENGSPMWQTIISFDNRWLEENGLYDSNTRILDVKRLMVYARNAVNPMLKAEGLENSVWSAAIHYNTDNLHIHVATVEPIPTRQKIIVNSKEEYRGKFKLSSIENCKSKMVNQIISNSLDNQKINSIMRDSIITAMRGNILLEDKEIIQQFLYVYKNLPEDKRAWKYGMNKIAALRPEIDRITQMWINKYRTDEFSELKNLLEKQNSLYNKAYGENSKGVYMENKIEDLFKRCGNAVLDAMRNMSFDDIKEYESMSYISAEVDEAAVTGNELNFDGRINYKSNKNASKNERKYWSSAFKAARIDLAEALSLEDETEKAAALESVLNIFKSEVAKGNDVAAYELGKCYQLGTFGAIDLNLSQQYFETAFKGFLNELNSNAWLENMRAFADFRIYNPNATKEEFQKAERTFLKNAERDEWLQNYLNYRVGRMLVDGIGVEKNVAEGISHLEQSTSPYASYTLGNLYYSGNYVVQDYEKAYRYFSLAGFSENNTSMPFAVYNMAEMLEKGLAKDELLDKDYLYSKALSEFIESEENGEPNDLVQYKIGSMLLSGKGCEIDEESAEEYLFQSARYGNTFAQTKLANLYLKRGDPNLANRAVFLLQLAADSNNTMAQYQFGKIRLDEKSEYFNLDEGLELLEKSAEQDNEYAQYALGSVYYKGTLVEKNTQTALQYLTAAAEKNNQFAQYTLGIIYLSDKDETIEQDVSKAIDFLNRSADQENHYAQYAIGKLHLENEDIKDIEKAVEYLTKSANNENPFAAFTLGNLYMKGEDLPTDEMEAEKWYSIAYKKFTEIEQDSGDDISDTVLYNLGLMNQKGLGTEKDINKAIEYFTRSADQKNEFAQFQLGIIYYKSDEIEQNAILAMQYLNLSAEQGNQFAQYTLGSIYLKGDITDQHIDTAENYLKDSADQGNQFAQYQLGRIYYLEEYGRKDIYKALYNFTESAKQENKYAQYQLGVIYYKGDDIDQNATLAMDYLDRSAKQDNQFALYQLGMIYLKGDIADKDINKALNYFETSADQDNQFAQYQLGKLYYFGEDGIDIDKDKAIEYLTKSAAQGNEYAQALLDWKPTGSFGFNSQMGFSETMISLSSDMRSLFERLANEHDHMLNQMIYKRLEREKQRETELQ